MNHRASVAAGPLLSVFLLFSVWYTSITFSDLSPAGSEEEKKQVT